MDRSTFVRRTPGRLAGLALVWLLAACGGGGDSTGPDGPTLSRISPTSGDVGGKAMTVGVSLSGSGFDAGNVNVTVSGYGVTVTNISVVSATSLTADFTIATDAPLGDRDVTVTTASGSTRSVRFTVERITHQVKLLDDITKPANLVVKAGELVEWTNVGDHEHTVSVYGDFEWVDALVEPGETFTHIFTEPGDYAFICIYHAEVSSVTVEEP